jgi:hypothetical protein
MKGLQFERDTALRFKELGWRVETTPQSNDYGADLVCSVGDEKLIVQCKDYTNNSIGIKGIQEVIGARSHYKGTIAALIFRGRVTKQAYALALSNNIFVFSIDDLEVGCILDRLKDREAIEEAEKRKAERKKITEDRRKNVLLKKRLALYDYEKQFIEKYIIENSDRWKCEWNTKYNSNNIANKTAPKGAAVGFFGFSLRFPGSYFFKPATSVKAPDYQSYVASILNMHQEDLIKKAQHWAIIKYKERIEIFDDNSIIEIPATADQTDLKIFFKQLVYGMVSDPPEYKRQFYVLVKTAERRGYKDPKGWAFNVVCSREGERRGLINGLTEPQREALRKEIGDEP